MSEPTKILGVPPHLYAYPLWWQLTKKDFGLQTDIPANLAINLRYKRLHGALLTPIDYARDYAMYRIIPHVAVSSKGESWTILLTFSKELRSIKTIAVDPGSSSEIVLTQLVLAEQYDIHPTFIPTTHPEATRHQTDATLHVGNPRTLTDAIDIVDAWTDLTELLYVHSIWVCREDDLTSDEMGTIISAAGMESLSEVSRTTPYAEEYLAKFDYTLDEEKVSALVEFLRMSYYHGILQDIPDVKMHTTDSPSRTGSRN